MVWEEGQKPSAKGEMMTEEKRRGFLASYNDGRDLRYYVAVATEQDKKTHGLSFASEMRWQRWYLEPGWYEVTIKPWYPPGMEPLEEE